MAVKANIGTYIPFKPEADSVFAEHIHPMVPQTYRVKPDQGVLPKGLVVAFDDNNLIVPFNPSATDSTGTPVGVLPNRVDTTKETNAVVGVHGVVYRDRIVVKNGNVDETVLKKLAEIGIWNIG